MSTDYSGLTRNVWPGTWSTGSNSPIALDTELRGTLQSISGDDGDRLTDIPGARLTEGMLVYVKTGYTAGATSRTGDNYYKYKLLAGESRSSVTGAMPNAEANWTISSLGEVGATGQAGQNGDRYQTLSSTPLTVGDGTAGKQTLTVEAGLSYTPNQSVTITLTSNIAAHMHGNVFSYNIETGVLVVSIVSHSAGGTTGNSWSINLSGAVGAVGATGLTGATGPSASLENLGVLPNSGIAYVNNQLQTIYNTLITDEAKSTSVGGMGATGAQALKNQSLVGVLDKILFPDILPTYSELAVNASGSYSSQNSNNVVEVGSVINQNISWNIVKNDLGGVSAFFVKRIAPAQDPLPAFDDYVFYVNLYSDVFTPSTPLNTTQGIVTSITDDVPPQFGFNSPNNPNYVYVGAYTDNYVVRKGETSWKVIPTTTAFQKKYNNKYVLDSRSFTGSPLLGNSAEYAAATVTGVYPYYYGKSSTLPIQSFIEQKINSSQANATVSLSVLGTISILFNAVGEYIWLAVHASYPVKTVWYNNEFNKGEINDTGFILSPVEYVFSSPLGRWSTETYNVYVSKIKTATFENIEFRN